MPFEPLTLVSSVDGRYRSITTDLADYFSEYALIRARVRVEVEYLMALSEKRVIRELTGKEKGLLQKLQNVSVEDAKTVKEIEKTTNHDVKAVAYFLKQKIKGTSLEDVSEWIHFGLTSEDINSVAYGLLLRDALQKVFVPEFEKIIGNLRFAVEKHAATPMLARTHGQPASPTTFGKEMKVFDVKIKDQNNPQLFIACKLISFST